MYLTTLGASSERRCTPKQGVNPLNSQRPSVFNLLDSSFFIRLW